MLDLINRLIAIEDRYMEVSKLITDPSVISDMKRYPVLMKEYKDLEVIVEKGRLYKKSKEDFQGAKDILYSQEDAGLKELAQMEYDELEPKIEMLESEIKMLLIPKDPEDERNCVVEIRGGTGGDEASIFAGDLFKMYTRYVSSKGWKYEVLSFSEGTAGGYKEMVFEVQGVDVYGTMKSSVFLKLKRKGECTLQRQPWR
jgi:peptide chain release factor 1